MTAANGEAVCGTSSCGSPGNRFKGLAMFAARIPGEKGAGPKEDLVDFARLMGLSVNKGADGSQVVHKPADLGTRWNASAASARSIIGAHVGHSGPRGVAFTLSRMPSGGGYALGFASGVGDREQGLVEDQSLASLDFAVHVVGRGDFMSSTVNLDIREGGAHKGSLGSFTSGDKVELVLNKNGRVEYCVNSQVRYTSERIPEYPLFVKLCACSTGSIVRAVRWIGPGLFEMATQHLAKEEQHRREFDALEERLAGLASHFQAAHEQHESAIRERDGRLAAQLAALEERLGEMSRHCQRREQQHEQQLQQREAQHREQLQEQEEQLQEQLSRREQHLQEQLQQRELQLQEQLQQRHQQHQEQLQQRQQQHHEQLEQQLQQRTEEQAQHAARRGSLSHEELLGQMESRRRAAEELHVERLAQHSDELHERLRLEQHQLLRSGGEAAERAHLEHRCAMEQQLASQREELSRVGQEALQQLREQHRQQLATAKEQLAELQHSLTQQVEELAQERLAQLQQHPLTKRLEEEAQLRQIAQVGQQCPTPGEVKEGLARQLEAELQHSPLPKQPEEGQLQEQQRHEVVDEPAPMDRNEPPQVQEQPTEFLRQAQERQPRADAVLRERLRQLAEIEEKMRTSTVVTRQPPQAGQGDQAHGGGVG